VLSRTSTKHDREDRDGTGMNNVFHLWSPLADGTGTGCDAFSRLCFAAGVPIYISSMQVLWTSMPSSMKQPNGPIASGA
jgi:hypothetical protein